MRQLLEISVTIGNGNISVTLLTMEITQLLEQLEKRGITVSLEKNGITTHTARPIPRSIALTISANEGKLRKHLEATVKEPKTEKVAPKVPVQHLEPPQPTSPPPTAQQHQGVAIAGRPNTVPRLPFDLERLISAASNERLELNLAGVHDPNRYVMGWACAYLTGDRQHALQMLRQAQQARVTN